MIDDALLQKFDIYDAEELRATLPKVGDRLMLRPTLYDKAGAWPAPLMPCVVTYVNREHLWYEAEFTLRDGTRIRQGFKVPETTYEGEERDDY